MKTIAQSLAVTLALAGVAPAQTTRPATTTQAATTRPAPIQPRALYALADVRMRDVCILPDPTTQTYYMVGPARRGVRYYTSKDLKTWDGPQLCFTTPDELWPDAPIVGIWAPEMHRYRDKYFLFLTFNTQTEFGGATQPGMLPRVRRGSQTLVGDSPAGPFTAFAHEPIAGFDKMTLDGTLWVEDGVPYMVYCHEWVQITDGTVECVRLKDDLSARDGEPTTLFHGSDATWSKAGPRGGNHVTDGPYLYRGKSGKLYMTWSSGGVHGYVCGIAISDNGKLAGPWHQQAEPLYDADGGHGMFFTTFDGRVMLVLHSPNGRDARPRVFELEDTGDTLRVTREFTGNE